MKPFYACIYTEINPCMLLKCSNLRIDLLLRGRTRMELNFKHLDFCSSFHGQACAFDHWRHDLQFLLHEFLQFLFGAADGFHVL